MRIWDDYKKVLSVIDSCVTIEQVESASKFLTLWYKKYLDHQVYKNTFSIVEDKFFNLGGVDLNDLYKKI
jgi:hypothetical protein